MDKLIAYLDMDGYAGFVWPSYAIALIVMAGLYFYVRAGLRRDERALARLQAAGAGRRWRRNAAAGAGPGETDGTRGEETAAWNGDALDGSTPPEDGGRA